MVLRVWVARRVPDLNQADARALIRAGGVYVNKLRVRVPSVRVAAGERVTVYPEALEIDHLDPGTLQICHRDPHLIVLDKPAGVPVAATRQAAVGTLSDALVRMLAAEGVRRPYVGVVHRLDQRASGLVLFTIRSEANRSIHKGFKEHLIDRSYLLQLRGVMQRSVTCSAPLLVKSGRSVQVATEGDPNALAATTHFEPVVRLDESTVVRATLATGRMHQIRVHASHLGHPVIGDARYGDEKTAADARGRLTSPLHLHAQRLRFEHPITGAPIDVQSAPPAWAPPLEDAPHRPPAE